MLSKSEFCLLRVYHLLQVLAAAPQLLQFCSLPTPLQPHLALESTVGWEVLKNVFVGLGSCPTAMLVHVGNCKVT